MTNWDASVTPKESSTYVAVEGTYETDFVTTIGIQGTVKGRFFNDTLSLEKYKLNSFKMVVASEAPSTTLGSLGLGFGREGNVTVLDAMVAADLIKSRTYSLWLNSLKSDTGAIIFGGYDTAKWVGGLTMLDSKSDTKFVVALTGLAIVPHAQNSRKFKRQSDAASSEEASATEEAFASATDESSADDVAQSFGLDGPLTAAIDSSFTFTWLPKDLVARLAKYVGATFLQAAETYVLPCESNVDADLYFQLGGEGGPEIFVDMTELLFPIPYPDNLAETMTFPGGRTSMCALGVTPIDSDQNVILGQTFLRSAYVFFDVDLKQIGFAQARWDVEESDIQEVANGDSVQSASSLAGASITQSASAARGAPGAGFTANATINVGEPGSPVTSLEGGVWTTLSGDRPHGGNRASATESAASHSFSVAAAPAIIEQSNAHGLLLALCGSIMLVAAMLL